MREYNALVIKAYRAIGIIAVIVCLLATVYLVYRTWFYYDSVIPIVITISTGIGVLLSTFWMAAMLECQDYIASCQDEIINTIALISTSMDENN